MTFDERNEAWTGDRRFFVQRQTRSSASRIWAVEVRGTQVFTEWGMMGGAMQNAVETASAVNVGKRNEIPADKYALYLGREKARKKHWEGYREINLAGDFLDLHVTEINFRDPPKNLCFWKPDNSPGPGITKKAEAGKVVYTRKMDGLMHPVFCDEDGNIQIYSRRMLKQHDLEQGSQYTWNDRFPHLVEVFKQVLPPMSIVLGELVAFDGKRGGRESLHHVEGFTKSLTPKALEEQARFGWAHYYVWDIAFWDDQDLAQESPVGARYDLIHEQFAGKNYIIPIQRLLPDQFPDYKTIDDFKKLAEQWDWEGFVMVDPEGIFGDRAYNFKGKPDRPGKFAAKVKPEYEDDFIVYWDPEKGYGEYSSKGRYGGKGMKSACLYQLNSKGEMVYIANVASGLTEEMKTNAHPSQFPQVWRVFYTNRRYQSKGDGSNAIDFPRVDEERGIIRTDKSAEECLNPLLD